MKTARVISVLLSGLILSSCFNMSLPESSFPDAKLNEANRHLARGQPLAAERLIMEAIRTYEANREHEGLGNAYRDYGVLLRSNAVTQREQTYREAGFLDSSITFDNRFEKSAYYLDQAIIQYSTAADSYQRTNRYDQLSSLYYTQAETYLLQNNNAMACSSYDKSRLAYAESIIRDRNASPAIPKGHASFHEAIDVAKRHAQCQ